MRTLFVVDLKDIETGRQASYVFDAPWADDIRKSFESRGRGQFGSNRHREWMWLRANGVPQDVALRKSKRVDDSAPPRYLLSIVDKRVKQNGGVLFSEAEPGGV